MAEYMEPLWKEHPDLTETAPIVHTFSNNGIQTWFNLAEVFQPHKGVIFDSGPSCPPTWDVPGLIFRLNNPTAPVLVKLAVSLARLKLATACTVYVTSQNSRNRECLFQMT